MNLKPHLSRMAAATLGLSLALGGIPTAALAEVVPMPEKQKQVVDGNYWAELNYHLQPSFNEGTEGIVIPTYLNEFFETSKADWAKESIYEISKMTFIFPNAGIREENNAEYEGYEDFWLRSEGRFVDTYTKKPGDEGYRPHKENPNEQYNYWKGGLQWMPYGLDEYKDLIKDVANDYNVYGDVTERNTSSTAIAQHKVGDTINLDMNVDLDIYRKAMNTMLVSIINSEFPAQELMKRNMPETGLAVQDGELVFVLDLPEGLEATGATTYKLSQLDNFTLAATTEKDGKRLVVKARMNQPANDYQMLKELYRKINAINWKDISLHIDGLKVTDKAPFDTNLTATAYMYGASDTIMSSDNDAIINKDDSVAENDAHEFARLPYVFAAKQSKAGLDSAAPADKPNLMTYSFRVSAPKKYSVTFIQDGKELSKVNVEDSKTIATGVDEGQAMPANPTKDGYSFEGWNTVADGSGTSFTADTPVTEDITVYAVFAKKESPKPNPEPNKPDTKPNKPASKTHPKKTTKRVVKTRKSALPQTGDAGVLGSAAMMALAGGSALLVSKKLKK